MLEKNELDAIVQAIQQSGQTIGQELSQTIQQLLQSTGASTAGAAVGTNVSESVEHHSEDIGGGERLTKENATESGILFLNQKEGSHIFRNETLRHGRNTDVLINRILNNAVTFDETMHELAIQTMQDGQAMSNLVNKNAGQRDNIVNNNAAFQSNVVNSQTTAHRDIATNEQWNLSEQNWAILKAMSNSGVDSAVIAQVLAKMATSDSEDE